MLQLSEEIRRIVITTGKRTFIDSIYDVDIETAITVAKASVFVGQIIISIVKIIISRAGFPGDYLDLRLCQNY